jgi:hypothetical protein
MKKNNKMKKNVACPCGPVLPKKNIKETFNNSSIGFSFKNIDKKLKKFFGKTKIIIGRRKYKLKKYRWFIVIVLIILLYLIITSFSSKESVETPGPVVIKVPPTA